MIKKSDWLAIAKDRAVIVLLLALVISCAVLVVTTILRVHSSDIQIPVRYTGFGQTFIYRDQWYMQYAYIFFGVMAGALNVYLALRFYQYRRMISLGILGMSVFLMIVGIVVSNAMFNLAPSL